MILCSIIPAQNLDFVPKTFTGNLTGAGGAGVAIVDGVNAIHFNPSGISNTSGMEALIFIEGEYYSYNLLNYLHARKSGRTFHKGKYKPIYPNVLLKLEINSKMGIGIGYVNYMTPFLINSKRATTWSTLFNQETRGVVRALVVSTGYQIKSNFSIGINISKYWGDIKSVIQGDKHGEDIEKSLEIITSLNGCNFRIGSQLKFANFNVGFTLDSPIKLKTNKYVTISIDSLYKNLIPQNVDESLEIPVNMSIGMAYNYSANWQILFDLTAYNINSSNLKLNIYEYSGEPNLKNGISFQLGLAYNPINSQGIPIRCGYALQPQMYASIKTTGWGTLFEKNKNERQNIKHIFSISSSFRLPYHVIDYGLKYSTLKWHRDQDIPGFIVEDTYDEKQISIFVNFLFKKNE